MNDVTYVGDMNETPEVYCAISILFNENVDITKLQNELSRIGISTVKISKPKNESVIGFDFAVVYYEHFWEIDDALTKMFSMVDSSLQLLKSIIRENDGEVYIDIAINQFGTAPSLIFSGENMRKIHFLNANISIDLL